MGVLEVKHAVESSGSVLEDIYNMVKGIYPSSETVFLIERLKRAVLHFLKNAW